MRVLLMSGLGPSFKNESLLANSLFDEESAGRLSREYYGGFDLGKLGFYYHGHRYPLLRRVSGRGSLSIRLSGSAAGNPKPIPHLTTFTLESILSRNGIEYQLIPLPSLWNATAEIPDDDFDVVLISTTFIWERRSLGHAIAWAHERCPAAVIILGGQYSNLKYRQVLRSHPEVFCVVRGDGELVLPRLLRALETGGDDIGSIPNLAYRAPGSGEQKISRVEYIDLEAYPSPSLAGDFPIVPYESMRGCPFSCKFCSFPHASPKWRYKSAQKIRNDWAAYAEQNNAQHIRAGDSTFTTPPTRLRELLRLLPEVGVGWEAFARANALKDEETVSSLVEAHCKTLSIGFESMSENTLKYMDKRVTATANRRAFELLRNSDLGYRISFMVGFPGESAEDFTRTQDFLVNDYSGYFMLNVFSLQDETMPVWADAEYYALHIDDPENPDYSWSHRGMDVGTARELMLNTFEQVRWRNDNAVHLLWQKDYETPLMPHLSMQTNLRLEKLIERVAMLPTHVPAGPGQGLLHELLAKLADSGVTVEETVSATVNVAADGRDLGF